MTELHSRTLLATLLLMSFSCGALADRIDGTPGDDVLQGTPDADRINGRAGNDRLLGGPGDDVLRGGGDRDRLVGGPGQDTLLGGPGEDIVDGKRGRDSIQGGGGADIFAISTLDRTVDQILDFSVAQNDTFDLSTVLPKFQPDSSLDDFVRLRPAGSSTRLQIDPSGNRERFQTIAILRGVRVQELTAAQFGLTSDDCTSNGDGPVLDANGTLYLDENTRVTAAGQLQVKLVEEGGHGQSRVSWVTVESGVNQETYVCPGA